MKRMLMIAFAGALFATAAFPDTNTWFRAKYGRDLPAVEQARNRVVDAARETAGYVPNVAMPAAKDTQDRFVLKTGRLTPQEEKSLETLTPSAGFSSAAPAHNDAEERFCAKTGRHTPQS